MTDRSALASLHRETLEQLLTDAFQAVRDALALNERLRGALDRDAIPEAHGLNDDAFLVLNELCQKVEQAVATEPEPRRQPGR